MAQMELLEDPSTSLLDGFMVGYLFFGGSKKNTKKLNVISVTLVVERLYQ